MILQKFDKIYGNKIIKHTHVVIPFFRLYTSGAYVAVTYKLTARCARREIYDGLAARFRPLPGRKSAGNDAKRERSRSLFISNGIYREILCARTCATSARARAIVSPTPEKRKRVRDPGSGGAKREVWLGTGRGSIASSLR